MSPLKLLHDPEQLLAAVLTLVLVRDWPATAREPVPSSATARAQRLSHLKPPVEASDLPLVRHVTTVRTLFALLAVAAATAVVILGSGCSAGRAGSASALVRVTESDFKIAAPERLTAGDVVLRVRNRGPDQHELLVIKLGKDALPYRGDGLTVDEEAVERNEVGVLEPGAPNRVRDLELHLTPGRYVLLCNMSGYYLGGMRRTLVVR